MTIGRFESRLEAKTLRVGVMGLGYVGLPLAAAFAAKGYRVTGYDVDRAKVSRLNAGSSHVPDVPSAVVARLVRSGRFAAATDERVLSRQDAILVCVPTPLNKTKEPDISHVVRSAEAIARRLKKGQLVVLESTTYPGTTEEVVKPILERAGLRAGRDFYLAFSPERVDPGNKRYPVTAIPKVVGGLDPVSGRAARLLYAAAIERVVPVSSTRVAEMAKLLENTFRSVNIGLINEMALLCDQLGIDIWEVIEAAKTKPFGFLPFYPGPGIGGHCLPIDPLYLSWKSRLHGFEARMIELAQQINQSMPAHVVERVSHLVNRNGVALKDAHVLVLGAAYKKDVSDTRESPALDVIERLAQLGAKVSYSDPHAKRLVLEGRVFRSVPLTAAALKRQDCVVLLTDHSAFDYEAVVKHSRLIFDTRNALRAWRKPGRLFFL